jgi:hypothetical protein
LDIPILLNKNTLTMKTKLLLLSLMTTVFIVQAQDRNRVSAMNNEISDNLDLRAVADIFGDSRNLQEFERQLNDPELQISNLDLNNDNEVDYLRVIETVENRTHVVIIQSVLDRDVYQDVATIEIEKDRYNKVHLQVVGNEYMYGQNYIYEPIYYRTPLIYASFWSYNYRPYVSNWYWDYYPSYYYAWNPFPVFRYRNNIQVSLNINNNYNYVNYRRSNQAVVLYNSRRSNAYERQYPNNNFSRRNDNVSNRHELEQRRGNRNTESRNEGAYSQNRSQGSRTMESPRSRNENRRPTSQRTETQRDYSQNRSNPSRENAEQRTETQRNNPQNRNNSSRESAPKRTRPESRDTQNRVDQPRESAPQRAQTQRNDSQNRANTPRESAPQRAENQRGESQKSATQRNESSRDNSSRGNNRRS